VHQWLGVQPDLGNGSLTVVPQVPAGQPFRVALDGRVLTDWTVRTTNRWVEVTVPTKAGWHTLTVTAG
jgi:hypothetical protein